MTAIRRNHLYMIIILFLTILLVLAGKHMVGTGYSREIERIRVEEARMKVLSGEALLVCAYEGPEKFRSVALEGAISLNSFREILQDLAMDKELIFY